MFFVCKGQYYAFNEQKGWWLPLDEVGYGTARGQDSKCHQEVLCHGPVQPTADQASSLGWRNNALKSNWLGRKETTTCRRPHKIGNGKWEGNIDILCFKKLQNLSAFYIFLHCLFVHLLFVRKWILPTATSLGNLIWCHTTKVKPVCCAKSHANFSSKTATGDVGCTPLGCAKPQR